MRTIFRSRSVRSITLRRAKYPRRSSWKSRAESEETKSRMWERARDGRYMVRQARIEQARDQPQTKEGRDPSKPRREVIPLDHGRVTIQCPTSASMEDILAMLR